MKTLQPGEIPTVNERGDYNEYIPPEMDIDEKWPVGFSLMDVSAFK